jgi:hypothetical protein
VDEPVEELVKSQKDGGYSLKGIAEPHYLK